MSKEVLLVLFQYIKLYHKKAFDHLDAASLAVFRIIFGILLMHDMVKGSQYYNHYPDGHFRPSYFGFEWLQANPFLIDLCAYILPLTIFCVIVGLFYRFAMALTTLLISYIFLISPEHFLNHYYMVILICILMSVVQANKIWSVDAYLKRSHNNDAHVPAWNYWILKAQIETILIYAGLVKINYDWLQLQPLGTWLRLFTAENDFLRHLLFFDFTVAIGAYGVIALHIIGAPLLFFRKTRLWVFSLYVLFHLLNHFVFVIGIFPFMTIGATLLFFDANWPRQILIKLRIFQINQPKADNKDYAGVNKIIVTAFFTIWVSSQILIPLPALVASNLKTAWHGHHDLFTWRMMLNNRAIYSQAFVVHIEGRGREQIEFVSLAQHLSKRQCFRVTSRGNTTIQFAHYLKDYYQRKYNADDINVHAYIKTSINFREPELWPNPKLDLAQYNTKYGIHEWIMPAKNPLRYWYDYLKAPKYIQPTYAEVLDDMNISKDGIMTFDLPDASLSTNIPKPNC